MKPRAKYPLMLPESVKRAAQRLAKQDGVSLNQFIAAAVAEKVGALEAAEAFFQERAATASGKGLLHYLDRAANEPPSPDDRLE
jgi:hypothetical protein